MNATTKIEKLATQVATEDAAHRDAVEAEKAARADLLVAVVEAVRPALHALSSRVPLAGSGTIEGGLTSEPAPWRGVYLLGPGSYMGGGKNEERGEYQGHALYLTESSRLVELRYSGRWSTVPGEFSTWKASVQRMAPATVAREYDVGLILDRLVAVLEQQLLGDKAEGTVLSRRRTAKIREAAKMLRGTL